jgi:secreted trypsin-like serine protease
MSKLTLALATLVLTQVCFAVYNGVPVQAGQYPYLVYIMVNPNDPSSTYACGGGLLSKRYVVSAGHCSFGTEFQIIIGRIDVNGYKTSDIVRVTKVVRPNNFGIKFDYNDIAIFTLEKEVAEVPYKIQYMDVGLQTPAIGAPLSLVGFGQIGVNQGTPSAHYSTIHVSDDKPCQAFNSYAPEVAFCSNDSDSYSCSGDSGSPIVVKPKGDEERWILVGLDSYGHEGACGAKNPATVIAKVSSMIDFIKQQTPLAPPNFVNLNYASTQAPVITTKPPPGVTTTAVPVATESLAPLPSTVAPAASKTPTFPPVNGPELVNILGWKNNVAEKSFVLAFLISVLLVFM